MAIDLKSLIPAGQMRDPAGASAVPLSAGVDALGVDAAVQGQASGSMFEGGVLVSNVKALLHLIVVWAHNLKFGVKGHRTRRLFQD